MKKVKIGKLPDVHKAEHYAELLQIMKWELTRLRDEHYDIIWVDETMFTTKTQVNRAWSPKGRPFFID